MWTMGFGLKSITNSLSLTTDLGPWLEDRTKNFTIFHLKFIPSIKIF